MFTIGTEVPPSIQNQTTRECVIIYNLYRRECIRGKSLLSVTDIGRGHIAPLLRFLGWPEWLPQSSTDKDKVSPFFVEDVLRTAKILLEDGTRGEDVEMLHFWLLHLTTPLAPFTELAFFRRLSGASQDGSPMPDDGQRRKVVEERNSVLNGMRAKSLLSLWSLHTIQCIFLLHWALVLGFVKCNQRDDGVLGVIYSIVE